MTIEIKVPALGESVTEATVGQWFKKPGEAVKADEPLVELETDKVTVEVPAPAAGVLADIKVEQGATVGIGSVLGSINEGAGAAAKPAASQPAASAPAARAPAAAATQAGAGCGARRQRRHAAVTGGAQVMEEKGLDRGRRAGLRPARPDPQGGRGGRCRQARRRASRPRQAPLPPRPRR